jgi:hypothetical protein
MTEKQMVAEIIEAGRKIGLPEAVLGSYCHAHKDGDCAWQHCPQLRDDEPKATGRHCPLDIHQEDRGYQ